MWTLTHAQAVDLSNHSLTDRAIFHFVKVLVILAVQIIFAVYIILTVYIILAVYIILSNMVDNHRNYSGNYCDAK